MLEGFLKVLEYTHKFQQIKRKVIANGEDRQETDSEHSFQLALLAWYIIQKENLNLEVEKVLKYALAHDLVEIYAGDTFAHDPDPLVHEIKKQKEQQAAERIRSELVDFPELHELIYSYEQRDDEESKFVYALDKILPPANIFLDGGRSWRRHSMTLAMIKENKAPKVAVSPVVEKYWGEILSLIEEDKDKLFS